MNGFGAWLSAQMTKCGFANNVELEHVTGIGNTTISRWRNETMAPSVDQLRKLEGPLRTPLLELLVRAGVLSPEEAKVSREQLRTIPPVAVADVAEAVANDPDLIDEAKQHLLNQYELLRRLSPVAKPSPSVARGKKSPRRTTTPSDQPELRAVARGGDPADRAEVARIARRAREQYERGKERKKQ